MIKFVKVLEYELRPNGKESKDVYNYIAVVTSQEIDPPSLKNGELVLDASVVLHSTLKRAVDCIRKIPTTEYLAMDELREIPFDFRQMCDEQEWNEHGSVIVRRKFKEMFIADTLLVKRKQIFDDIREVSNECERRGKQDIAIVSHSFRMKIIEAFIETAGEIENNPKLIEGFIQDTEKTYDFGGGFMREHF